MAQSPLQPAADLSFSVPQLEATAAVVMSSTGAPSTHPPPGITTEEVQRPATTARPCVPLFLLFLVGGGRGRGRAVGLEDELAVGLVDQLAVVRLGLELAHSVAAGPDLAGHSDARSEVAR